MTDPKIYFQWQNDVLVKTIYPLREMKLRHVLEYFMEIDLWAQYKDKKIDGLVSDVAEYHARKKDVITKALKDFQDLLNYFLRTDIQPDASKPADEKTLDKIKVLHTSFKTYFPALKSAFKESYFISQRLEELDKNRKMLDQDISAQLRRLNAIKTNNPNHPSIPNETKKLEMLQNVQPVMEERRRQLVALVSAHAKLAKRKTEYEKKLELALKRQKEIETILNPLQARIAQQEAKLRDLQDELQRLHTQPDRASVEKYFSTPDVTADIISRFQQIDQDFLKKITGIHLNLSGLKDNAVKLSNLKNHIFGLQLEKTRFERRTGLASTFKENTLKAFEDELTRMKDFKAVLEYSQLSPTSLSLTIKAREEEMARVQGPITSLKKDTGDLQSQLDALDDILQVTEEKYVSEYVPVQPTVKDIVLQKVDDYKAALVDKDQSQLLEMIVERFKKEPTRYPRWLQYMIVHFSGMRYASAHGSWADPRDLYMNLRTAQVETDLKKLDDDAVAELCSQKLEDYAPTQAAALLPTGLTHEPPKLAKAQDAKLKEKIEIQLARIRSDNPYSRRTGLFNLTLDEENYDVEMMTEDQALEALERIKDTLPEWMWKEISAHTDIRLTDTKDANWEKLTPEEQQQRSSAESARYREIMNKWKQDHLVGWREEHELTSRLIVSRAVCNEVAEHILHLRGFEGPAGLTGAQDWYINAARGGKTAQPQAPNDKAYFIKPTKIEDYREGAAILWLRYRNDPPNPWDVVNPFTTSNGAGLVPQEYLSRRNAPGSWAYKNSGLERSRTFVNDKSITVTSNQYLYWVHTATVAIVAETAEGKVVLTFETALPYEDRRLSSVGLFKHYDYNILFDGGEDAYNGSFVGYNPENKTGAPTKDLEEMLNWDHVLLK